MLQQKLQKKKIITDSLELPATAYANEKVQITTVVSEKIKRILF